MRPDFSPDLRRELLEDFYAECEELLTSARAALDLLESKVGKPESAQASLEAVFRDVHSLKGISAIVGLRHAEQMAHGMEDVLRILSKHEMAVTAESMDALLGGLQRFEQIVSSHRLGKESPGIADALEALRRSGDLGRAVPAAADAVVEEPGPEPKVDSAEEARARGLQLWRCTFIPAPALDQRGINVTSVRARLGEIGEILSATPTVRAEGGIRFEFVVGLREAPADLPVWDHDGMALQPIAGQPGEKAGSGLPAPELLSLTPSHIVRVDLSRLDDLMRIAGEMVIHRSRLDERLRRYGGDAALKETNLALARSLRELREGISRVRLVPIGEIFTSMPLVIRQLARSSPKKARVDLEGQQTPIDKYLVERLKEPLLHLVRNAFAHGIEPPEERLAAGKPAEAAILLRAHSAGASVVIQVKDDGRGIDPAIIAARAAALGLAVPEPLDAARLLAILCTPGFSTREEADLAAGRGVGMAVVAKTLRDLGGTIALDSAPGRGTEFTLQLPLTLSIVEAIIVTVDAEICAVPQASVAEIIRVAATEVRTIGATEVAPYRGGLLPLVRLRRIFQRPLPAEKFLTLLVLGSERGSVGLAVDGVRTQREVVVRPLLDPLVRVAGISGATELGDGRPILILDPAALTRGVVRPPAEPTPAADPGAFVSRRP